MGNVKSFVALGLLSSFGCPLSFGPVRSVFSPLFSLSLVRLLSANVVFFFLSLSLSLSLSQVLGKCKPCSVCISPCVSSSWPRSSPSTRTSSSSPSPRLRVFGEIFGGKLFVLMVCGCVVSLGVVFASILVLLERLLSRKLPDKNFLIVRSCFLGAFSSSLVSSSLLFAFALFFSLSSSFSLLFLFFLCFFEERKIRLTGHAPPSHVSFGLVFGFCPLAALFPARFGRASFWRFWGAFLGPLGFWDFLDLL